jgi:hypothetical protein
MSEKHSLLSALHEATHAVPGVPAHVDRPARHYGGGHHGRPNAPARPPRVLVGWQRRIAALFGQQIR